MMALQSSGSSIGSCIEQSSSAITSRREGHHSGDHRHFHEAWQPPLSQRPGKPIDESIVLGLKGRRLLLVLDNCELVGSSILFGNWEAQGQRTRSSRRCNDGELPPL
jgi:hypothetical protein